MRVYSYTEPREAILDYDEWLLGRDGDWRPATVTDGRRHGKTVLARLEGCDDRDAAASLIGDEIAVPREELPPLPEGRYYWTDLVGLRVEHRDGSELGVVDHLLETGANDVLVVKGEREILIPFVPEKVVLDVDLDAGVIRVDWEWD